MRQIAQQRQCRLLHHVDVDWVDVGSGCEIRSAIHAPQNVRRSESVSQILEHFEGRGNVELFGDAVSRLNDQRYDGRVDNLLRFDAERFDEKFTESFGSCDSQLIDRRTASDVFVNSCSL